MICTPCLISTGLHLCHTWVYGDTTIDMKAGEMAGRARLTEAPHLLPDDGVYKADERAGPFGKSPDLVPVLDDLHRQESGCGHHSPVPEGCKHGDTC